MATLNNPLAYGFAKNVVLPLIMKSFTGAFAKAKVSVAASHSSEFSPIVINVKNGRKNDKYSVVVYYNNGKLALSLYNMMYSDNIAFINVDKKQCITVPTKDLQENWKNIMVKMSKYDDGVKVRSEMTYADIDKVTALASNIITLTDDIINEYAMHFNKTFQNTRAKKLSV